LAFAYDTPRAWVVLFATGHLRPRGEQGQKPAGAAVAAGPARTNLSQGMAGWTGSRRDLRDQQEHEQRRRQRLRRRR